MFSHPDVTWSALTSSDNLKFNIYKGNLVQLSQVHYNVRNSRNYRHVFTLKCFPVTLKEIM